MRLKLITVSMGFLVSASVGIAETITTGTLVREMVDMKRLGRFPDPAYRTIQFSSYDHQSTLPGGPHWFANSDGFGNEPVPNFEEVIRLPADDRPGEYLICDVAGPGAIVRTWTAAIGGEIRLYLDADDTPVYAGSAQDFLINPWNRFAGRGVDTQAWSGTMQQRNAGYFPIPFAKRCRIVWEGNHHQIHFYQVQIRLYEPDANVTTFTAGDLQRYADDINTTSRILGEIDREFKYTSESWQSIDRKPVPPGTAQTLYEHETAAAIEALTLKVEADDLDRALRQTILHIFFDGFPWAQVQSPIGDFFGAGLGVNPYDSLPFTVRPDGSMTCRYVMPFAKNCRIAVENRGGQEVRVSGSVLPMTCAWDDERSMHFRARWRVDHDVVASGGDAAQDMPYLMAGGKGVYVGSTTILLNPNTVPTPGGNWWGEGDEKIFVDDDLTPSTFGTGSEDYYNYAWSSPDIFIHPYCGQPRNDGPANRGFVTNYRWHILDPLPFQKRFAFYMELYHHEKTPGVSYARTGYHYARPGLIDDHVAITNEDVRHLELPANWEPAARGAAHNSTFFQVEDVIQGNPQCTFIEDNLYAGGKCLVWHPGQTGDELRVVLPLDETRNWTIHMVAGLNPRAGTVSVHMDDQRIMGGERGVIDLHSPHRRLLREFASGKMKIDKGDREIRIRYEGPSKDGSGATVPIDFFWIQRRS